MTNPYQNLPDYQFWKRSITEPHPGQIDPVVNYIKISRKHKIATMGSCFAQNLAKNIINLGFNYFVTEPKPDYMSHQEASGKQYGTFSARYGNVYTVKQASQLFDRCYGLKNFGENVWSKDENYIDAFRPTIHASGFSTINSLLEDRKIHLQKTKKMFSEMDVFIFTLGLTEAWRSKSDLSVFPLAPGVFGGEFDNEKFEFINFDFHEVKTDLFEFIEKIQSYNKSVEIILTVSPVPLIATYENRSVLVSSTLSKSILRVACDEAERKFKKVVYFPSYEIITSPANNGRYYKNDLREVTDLGVDHVMRLFKKHFLTDEKEKLLKLNQAAHDNKNIIEFHCDEDEIEASISASMNFPK